MSLTDRDSKSVNRYLVSSLNDTRDLIDIRISSNMGMPSEADKKDYNLIVLKVGKYTVESGSKRRQWLLCMDSLLHSMETFCSGDVF